MNEPNDSHHEDFTASSLARAEGVHRSYIARLCREGKIKAKKFATVWIISYEAGTAWRKERQAKRQAQES